MTPEIQNKWTEALRSGEYEQAGETLRYKSSYCCLGVLLDVCAFGQWDDETYIQDQETMDGELTQTALNRVGLTQEEQKRLITLNDDRHYNFEQIADYIDKGMPDLPPTSEDPIYQEFIKSEDDDDDCY